MAGPTDNSESSTPTEAQVEADRLTLQRNLSDLQRVMRTRVGRVDADLAEPYLSRQIAHEAVAALARAEVVLDMAADVVRVHTEQLVIDNKIRARELRLQREQVEQGKSESRRVDKVLDVVLNGISRVATDSRVWTAIATTVLWFLGQLATGNGCIFPLPAP